ncbi:CGNR zinc finger domain-containing protein [Longispora urticae]
MRNSDGGAPRLGEPLPIEFANATYAVRGQIRDGLGTAEHLAEWLASVRDRLATPLPEHPTVSPADLAAARSLRDTVRALADAAAHDRAPAPDAVAELNRRAAAVPRWRELRWDDGPAVEARSAADPVGTALAELADAAVTLFAGPDRTEVHSCPGPGCVLYFVRDHPRREWCSAACGNRARAARYYERHRGGVSAD